MTTIGWHADVLRWAEDTPDAPALVGPTESLTFKQLAWRGQKLAAALESAGVSRGQIAMVRARREWDFQLTLALSMLGATSVSNTAKQYLDFEPHCDWLITRTPVPEFPTEKQIIVNDLWVQRAFNNTEPFEVVGLASEDDIERICLTSGTTGRPKAVALSRKIHAQRVADSELATIGKGVELYLVDMGAAIGTMRALAASAAGLPYLHLGKATPEDIRALCSRVPIERIGGSPAQLQGFLDLLIRQKAEVSSLSWVRVGGATVPQELMHLVARITPNPMQIGYGSTEAGPITMRNVGDEQLPDSVGYLLPGAEAEVIDEHGGHCAPGEVGTLRLRSASSVSEYWRDAESTAEHFKDGWFYPGDRAALTIDGQLLIKGRVTEVLNLGGLKIDPVELESVFAEFSQAQPVVAFSWQDNRGAEHIGFATTSDASVDSRRLERELKRKYRFGNQVKVLRLEKLPLTDSGKIARARLTELAQSRFA